LHSPSKYFTQIKTTRKELGRHAGLLFFLPNDNAKQHQNQSYTLLT